MLIDQQTTTKASNVAPLSVNVADDVVPRLDEQLEVVDQPTAYLTPNTSIALIKSRSSTLSSLIDTLAFI